MSAGWFAMGSPKANGRRNDRGSLIDGETGMAITKPERGAAPVVEQSVAWLVRQFMASAQAKALKPSTRLRFDALSAPAVRRAVAEGGAGRHRRRRRL